MLFNYMWIPNKKFVAKILATKCNCNIKLTKMLTQKNIKKNDKPNA